MSPFLTLTPSGWARFAREYDCRLASKLLDLAVNDVIVTMLPTGHIVRQVLLDGAEGGLAGALKPGTIVIDMSSSEPLGTQKLGTELAKRQLVLIDAPVSGGVQRAQTGKLTIMIGANDAAAVERVKPVLLGMGERLFETGPLGCGHAMKALNNYVAAACFAATAEAILIGERFGLDPATIVDIMNVSTGRNFQTETAMKDQVLNQRFASGFSVGLLAKDVKIAADLGEGVGVGRPLVKTGCRAMGRSARPPGAEPGPHGSVLDLETESEPFTSDCRATVTVPVQREIDRGRVP